MESKLIYTPKPDTTMKVAAFMSGSGTNLVKIIEYQNTVEKRTGIKPYEVTLILSDNVQSNARAIAEKYGLTLLENDILEYYRAHGKQDKKDLSLRPGFDEKTVDILSGHQFDILALAGYMSILTSVLLDAYKGRFVNVHPADLSVKDCDMRLYTGDRAVAKAIKCGEKYIHSTTHTVGEKVDYGPILMISPKVEVILPEGVDYEFLARPENKKLLNQIADDNQERLKEQGDWVIFPRTLEMIAQGRYALDDNEMVYLDGKPIPHGFRLESA